MSEDIVRLIFGYLFFYGAPVGMLFVIFNKIKKIIISYKKGYKKTNGKVVKYIKDTDEEYIQQQKENLMKKHPKLYEVAMDFIKKHNVKEDNSKNPFYYAIIEYEVAGKKYQIQNTVGVDSKGELGVKRKIKYNPNNPEEAMLVKDWSHILLIFVLVITMMIGYGLIYY